MAFEKRARRRAPGENPYGDDGVDPRVFFRPSSRRDKQTRKAGQLGRQVAETLALVLAGECDDPLLHNLLVVSVQATAPSQLLVTVAYEGEPDPEQARDIEQRLACAAGRLRTEVAAAITRKRAPRLAFRVVSSQEVER